MIHPTTSFAYFRPRALHEVWPLWQEHPQARYIAGGTDVMVRLRQGNLKPEALISLRHVDELCGITHGETTRLGASTRVADIAADCRLREQFPALAQAADRLGSMQVRNAATLGGNLCNASPCADLAPPLLAHGARLRLVSPTDSRELPAEQLFVAPGQTALQPGEVLEAILLPTPQSPCRSVFLKQGRVHMDLAQVNVAALVESRPQQGPRFCVVAGAVAPRPLRLRAVEELLDGGVITEGRLQQARRLAEQEVDPISDLRATAEYRRHLTGVLVERALRHLTELHGGEVTPQTEGGAP